VTTREMDRRRFLLASGTLAGAALLGRLPADATATAPRWQVDPFTLGIASGDPAPDGVVLWTRLAPDPLQANGGMPPRDVAVRWEVAGDPSFRRHVRKGWALATPELAHSVHVEVGGLAPDREYWYRFTAGSARSAVGRTRTLPGRGARTPEVAFAFASCQRWDEGYYPAYAHMAEDDIDFVVHLGDYVYEYGIDANGGYRNVPVPEQFRPETVTLDRYRLQHALYRTDPDLQRAHALFPWFVTWDDHEVENDYTGTVPQDPPGGAAFLARRDAAYRAYYEHLPLRRISLPRGHDVKLYRRFGVGDLVEFNVLDGRQYRSDHPCGDGETPRCDAALDPSQTMLGFEQERWLEHGLARSGARWNVLGNQVLMAQLDHVAGPDQVFWNDSWDGYPAARRRMLEHIVRARARNPIVITGDWHSTFVSDIKLDFDDTAAPVVATEFSGTSISSNGDAIVYGPYYGPMIPNNPHIKFFDGDRRGYVRCRVTPREWEADLRMVTTVSRPDAPAYTFASFVVEDGRPGAQRVS
jgi:alkaline phosphatase D